MKDDRNRRALSPCINQTKKQIAAYYESAAPGAPAVVRRTQYGLLHYTITFIEGQNLRLGRVYICSEGAFFQKTGCKCRHPQSQTTLVVPTEDVLKWAAKHPNGEFGIAHYHYHLLGEI